MGRPRKPTAVKKAEGNRGKRGDSPDEPQPESGEPVKPEHLKGVASQAWDDLVPQLAAMGTLCVSDGHALAAYCRTYARWLEYEQFIDENGPTYELKSGYIGQHPQAGMSKALLVAMNRYQNNFGMTPAGRTTVKADKRPSSTRDKLFRLLKMQKPKKKRKTG